MYKCWKIPRRSRGDYSTLFTEPEENNCLVCCSDDYQRNCIFFHFIFFFFKNVKQSRGGHCVVLQYYNHLARGDYINNSLHLARKYARIFFRGHYLFREENSFPRAKLEENCELRGTDNVQGQISVHIFEDKWRLLCLFILQIFFAQSRARDLLICQQIL